MLIIQHRANNLIDPITSDVAEIDVHIDTCGDIIIKHSVDEPGWDLDEYLLSSKHKKFFVDIKQNLDVEYYKKIEEEFGDRLIGLFDVPFPSSFYANKERLPIYRRISEYESNDTNFYTRFWIDPLLSWGPEKYSTLISRNIMYGKIIVACPSLHGQPIEVCKKLWRYLEQRKDIEGIVTKYVDEFRRI